MSRGPAPARLERPHPLRDSDNTADGHCVQTSDAKLELHRAEGAPKCTGRLSELAAHDSPEFTLFSTGGDTFTAPELSLPSLGTDELSLAEHVAWSNQLADAKARVERARHDFNSACTPDASLDAWHVLLDARRDVEECAAAAAGSACQSIQLIPDRSSLLSMHRRSEAQGVTGVDVSCGTAMEEQIHREMVEYSPEIAAPRVLSYWIRRTQKVQAARAREAKCAAALVQDASQGIPEGDLQIHPNKPRAREAKCAEAREALENIGSLAIMNQLQDSTKEPKTNSKRRSRRMSVPTHQLVVECAKAVALNPKAIVRVTNSSATPTILECRTRTWIRSEHLVCVSTTLNRFISAP